MKKPISQVIRLGILLVLPIVPFSIGTAQGPAAGIKKEVLTGLGKGFVEGVGSFLGEKASSAIFGALGLGGESGDAEAIEKLGKELGEKLDQLGKKMDGIRTDLHAIHADLKEADEHAEQRARYAAWSRQDAALRERTSLILSLWRDCVYDRRSFEEFKEVIKDGQLLKSGDFVLDRLRDRTNGVVGLFSDVLSSHGFTAKHGWDSNSCRMIDYVENYVHHAQLAFVMRKAVAAKEQQRGVVQSFLDQLEQVEDTCFLAHVRTLHRAAFVNRPSGFMGKDNRLFWRTNSKNPGNLEDPWTKFERIWQTYRPFAQFGETGVTRTTLIQAWNARPRSIFETMGISNTVANWSQWLVPESGGKVTKHEIKTSRVSQCAFVRCVFFLTPGRYLIEGNPQIFRPTRDAQPGAGGSPPGSDPTTVRYYADGWFDPQRAHLLTAKGGKRMIEARTGVGRIDLWRPFFGIWSGTSQSIDRGVGPVARRGMCCSVSHCPPSAPRKPTSANKRVLAFLHPPPGREDRNANSAVN